MADDQKKSKGSSKIGETLLGVLGSLGTIAGPLIMGPDFNGVDFGQPFKLGSAYLQNQRMEKDLIDVLNSNPHTKGIPEAVGSAVQGGGLPSLLMGQAPQQLSVPQAPQPSVAPQGQLALDPSLMPQGQIEQQLLPQQAPQVAPQPEQPNQVSPILEYMARNNPQMLSELLAKKEIGTNSNPLLDMITLQLKLNQLESFQTPDEKLQDKFKVMDKIGEQVQIRQSTSKQEAAQLEREKWGAEERKGLVAHNDATFALQSMLDDFKVGGMPGDLAKLMSGNAFASGASTRLNLVTPRDIQMSRNINKMVMEVVKRQSGVQYGFRELQWIKATQPSQWDSPELFQNGLNMALNNNLFNKYDLIISKAERAGNAEVALREGMTSEQIKAFQILKKRLGDSVKSGQNDSRVFADPMNQKLLDVLGMGLLTNSVGK